MIRMPPASTRRWFAPHRRCHRRRATQQRGQDRSTFDSVADVHHRPAGVADHAWSRGRPQVKMINVPQADARSARTGRGSRARAPAGRLARSPHRGALRPVGVRPNSAGGTADVAAMPEQPRQLRDSSGLSTDPALYAAGRCAVLHSCQTPVLRSYYRQTYCGQVHLSNTSTTIVPPRQLRATTRGRARVLTCNQCPETPCTPADCRPA